MSPLRRKSVSPKHNGNAIHNCLNAVRKLVPKLNREQLALLSTLLIELQNEVQELVKITTTTTQ
jgi:hypothetical protein